MLGPVFLLFYRFVTALAWCLPRDASLSLRARWAFYFAALTDGGLDDDFAEELFTLIRQKPDLTKTLAAKLDGNGWSTQRRRLLLATLEQCYAAGRTTTF